MAATSQLKRLVHGKKNRCQIIARDKYGRTVARCYLPDGRDVGALMIQSGHAKEMRGFSRGYYSNL
ncbi:thermonuclease family protein [Aestuariibius sp. HNIBRBA575]|uniref:thermonuclease family protein n=1 Tax=Aestuariibius sp. HNIBRBA575 TaxID=3233343 RepID=UPI0034A26EC1